MNNNDFSLILPPFIKDDLFKNTVRVTSEGGYRPCADNSFPMMPFLFSDWQTEELSWYDNCYVHAGLNPFIYHHFKGLDTLQLLTDYTVSTYKNFPVGKARHAICCNDDGKILMDGIILRLKDDEFLGMCIPTLAAYAKDYDIVVEDQSTQRAFFQLCGPRSLEIVEDLVQKDMHDLKFMCAEDVLIAGKEAFILRAGMGGTLGYEVHCKMEEASDLYSLILQAGEPYCLKEIGRHAYVNAHTEGSFPQGSIHFPYADSAFPATVKGSFNQELDKRFCSPIDVGWEKMIKFDHDFPGKAALREELDGHHNTVVTLKWEQEDILKVIATYFEDNSCDIMDMVHDYDYINGNGSQHIDEVYDGEKLIGFASGRMLSPKTKEMISLGFIDEDYKPEGTIVEVLWGRPGIRQMRIKAQVTRYPYITELRNEKNDVTNTIPKRY